MASEQRRMRAPHHRCHSMHARTDAAPNSLLLPFHACMRAPHTRCQQGAVLCTVAHLRGHGRTAAGKHIREANERHHLQLDYARDHHCGEAGMPESILYSAPRLGSHLIYRRYSPARTEQWALPRTRKTPHPLPAGRRPAHRARMDTQESCGDREAQEGHPQFKRASTTAAR